MKKILLILFIAFSQISNAQYYTLVNKQSDTISAGSSYFVDLKLINSYQFYQFDPIKMMAYSDMGEHYILSDLINLQYWQYGGGGPNNIYGTAINSTITRFTFTMPISYRKWIYLFSNRGSGPMFLDSVYVTSPTPDMLILNQPLSASPSDSIHFNLSWTYKYSNTDSLKITIGTKVQETIAVNDIKGGIVGIKVNSNYGVYPMSFSGATNYSYSFTVLNSITSIVEPFDSSKQSKTINYYDILGRPATPKDGDMIRYTSIGAVVY